MVAPFVHHVMSSGAIIAETNWIDPEIVFAPHAQKAFSIWFDSSDTRHPQGQHSFICIEPFETIEAKGKDKKSKAAHTTFSALSARLCAFENIWHGLPSALDAMLPRFRGGAAGMFSYNLARELEKLLPQKTSSKANDWNLPDLAIGFYSHVLAFDHKTQRCFIFATGLPHEKKEARKAAAKNDVKKWNKRLADCTAANPLPPADLVLSSALNPVDFESNFTQAAYENAVRRIIAHIRAGDIFQANLSQCFTAQLSADDSDFNFYRRLRRKSPAPFSAFAQFEGWSLASVSPERFLQIRDRTVETNPIKGTVARGKTPDKDAVFVHALQTSAKDHAENIMIVDLLRNDLARFCTDDTIKVVQLCALESFANVHHLVSKVVGKLQMDKNPIDALSACFPGGSITGAPKIRAMEIIAEIEPLPRGPYCGAIGYIGYDAAMDTNIIIRTGIICGKNIRFQAGGGITLDSQPRQEYNETLVKTEGFMQALGVAAELLQTDQAMIKRFL